MNRLALLVLYMDELDFVGASNSSTSTQDREEIDGDVVLIPQLVDTKAVNELCKVGFFFLLAQVVEFLSLAKQCDQVLHSPGVLAGDHHLLTEDEFTLQLGRADHPWV